MTDQVAQAIHLGAREPEPLSSILGHGRANSLVADERGLSLPDRPRRGFPRVVEQRGQAKDGIGRGVLRHEVEGRERVIVDVEPVVPVLGDAAHGRDLGEEDVQHPRLAHAFQGVGGHGRRQGPQELLPDALGGGGAHGGAVASHRIERRGLGREQ